jgi:hypothetical protein
MQSFLCGLRWLWLAFEEPDRRRLQFGFFDPALEDRQNVAASHDPNSLLGRLRLTTGSLPIE